MLGLHVSDPRLLTLGPPATASALVLHRNRPHDRQRPCHPRHMMTASDVLKVLARLEPPA